jgi:hypothetical protein
MVDVSNTFKTESDPASRTTAPAPAAPATSTDRPTPDLNNSFIKAGDGSIVVNPEPGKKSLFSRQVVTPTVGVPKPDK